MLSHSPSVQTLMAEKSWWQECEAAGHIVSTAGS